MRLLNFSTLNRYVFDFSDSVFDSPQGCEYITSRKVEAQASLSELRKISVDWEGCRGAKAGGVVMKK